MKTIFLLTLACLTVEPLWAEDAKSEFAPMPFVMSVQIGGMYGPSYEIVFDERQLRYYAAEESIVELEDAKPLVLEPTNDEWQEFLDELERLKVWDWKRRYDDPDIADGTQWRAVICYELLEPRDLIASGNNAFPEGIEDFLAAVSKLVGGRKFE